MDASPGGSRRHARRLGTALAVLGLLVLAYAAAVLLWRDPATDLYATWQQRRLTSSLERSFAEVRASAPEAAAVAVGRRPAAVPTRAPTQAESLPRLRTTLVRAPRPHVAVREAAVHVDRVLDRGDALGRIAIPKLGLDRVFVEGTRWGADLSRGPGHYEETALPGAGGVTAIAGHRTTFGAPFRHIDDLGRGDAITLTLAYGTFTYRVFEQRIVDDHDWSILRERGFETLVLSACHPLYSAEQRLIVSARLVHVALAGGVSYAVAPPGSPTTPAVASAAISPEE